ncbi:transferrin-like, partial [Ostrinia furnacalis]|uniref:transferrin-like n=1 Tax=Ostrinia furnacalis TaxID=93504 RepID=UPI00103915A3
MGYKGLFFVFLAIGLSSAQISKVCVPTSDSIRCQNLDKDGSQVSCEPVSTRVECAARLVRGAADFGVFSDEELLLLAQQSNDLRVVATVRDVNRQEPYSFEAVVVVPNNHTNGFAGLQNGRYCHPGFGVADIRWSPRVLRAMEVAAARTDRCEGDVGSRTAEEMEVTTLSNFFSEACRPGPWSANATLDANLKSRFPNLCAMCSAPGVCAGYDASAAVSVAGVLNSNRHIQALDCLTTNGTVAFVAWQHVREFFTLRSPQFAATHSILCEDGSLAPLTTEALNTPLSPCSLVKQPWSAVVARSAVAETVASNLRTWWPTGADFGASSWQTNLFAVLAGGANWNLVHETNLVSPANYTGAIRNIPSIDSAPSCLPARRWCTVSTLEQTKCTWVRNAAHSLGIQPPISCQQRASVFDCLDDIRESRSDFFSVDSHYGYLARRHYNLSPVKLVQNSRGASSRVATLIKSSAAENITRFENLRDRVACFPEYGSIAYVAFLRAAQDRGVISSTQCNYQRAVGEFFSGACAPGALHHSHTISDASDTETTVISSTQCNYQRAVGEFFSGACAPGALHHSHTISDASD